jgi:hypothetical protein
MQPIFQVNEMAKEDEGIQMFKDGITRFGKADIHVNIAGSIR